ncbi:MAG: DinB family protein [Candidatus Eisenbacteria bacterium]
MFRRMNDFLGAYRSLSEGTGRLLEAMNDRTAGQPVAEGHRTLGRIAWHIVTTVPEMMKRTGLPLSSVDPDLPPPESAAEIAVAHRAVSAELVAALEKGWSDDTLEKTDDMYGEMWPRGKTLAALISHEMHHRGQMTVLLRQAGAKVPGLFGPSKEEWARFGMQPPPY